jgi:rubredoxin
MEKYYCDRCRILYDQEENCKICGILADNKIWIEIQTQTQKENP